MPENEHAKNSGVLIVVALVSVVTGLMSPMYVMIVSLSSNFEAHKEEARDLRNRLIAPAAALSERVDGLIKAVEELDRTLQLEMLQIAETQKAELHALDAKIQGEIQAGDNLSEGRHDVQGEQLRGLERVVFPKATKP